MCACVRVEGGVRACECVRARALAGGGKRDFAVAALLVRRAARPSPPPRPAAPRLQVLSGNGFDAGRGRRARPGAVGAQHQLAQLPAAARGVAGRWDCGVAGGGATGEASSGSGGGGAVRWKGEGGGRARTGSGSGGAQGGSGGGGEKGRGSRRGRRGPWSIAAPRTCAPPTTRRRFCETGTPGPGVRVDGVGVQGVGDWGLGSTSLLRRCGALTQVLQRI